MSDEKISDDSEVEVLDDQSTLRELLDEILSVLYRIEGHLASMRGMMR